MVTITGSTRSILSNAAVGIRIIVRTLATATVVGPSVILSGQQIYYTDAEGGFSFAVEAGDYEVVFNGTDRFQINVPGGTGFVDFLSRITSQVTLPSPFPASSAWPTFPADAEWFLTSTGHLVGRNLDTGKFHRIYLTGPDEAPTFGISTPGTTTP